MPPHPIHKTATCSLLVRIPPHPTYMSAACVGGAPSSAPKSKLHPSPQPSAPVATPVALAGWRYLAGERGGDVGDLAGGLAGDLAGTADGRSLTSSEVDAEMAVAGAWRKGDEGKPRPDGGGSAGTLPEVGIVPPVGALSSSGEAGPWKVKEMMIACAEEGGFGMGWGWGGVWVVWGWVCGVGYVG